MPSPSTPGYDDTPLSVDELMVRARLGFSDADPVQLARAVEQSLAIRSYDDHGLTAFAFVLSMLKVGVPIEDVVQVVALTKLNLMGQRRMDTGEHPDEVS